LIKAVIFAIDGSLIDSIKEHAEYDKDKAVSESLKAFSKIEKDEIKIVLASLAPKEVENMKTSPTSKI
jgi:archaellum biogenesis ATPase FlaH